MAPRIPRSIRLPIRFSRPILPRHLGRAPIKVPERIAPPRPVTAPLWKLVMAVLVVLLFALVRLIGRMVDAIRDARASETMASP